MFLKKTKDQIILHTKVKSEYTSQRFKDLTLNLNF